MVTCLSIVTRLEEFELGSKPRDSWGSRRLPPSTRYVLPALVSLQFKGVYEYMEDLMARIDAPQLVQFIGCTPQSKELNELHVLFYPQGLFPRFHGHFVGGSNSQLTRKVSFWFCCSSVPRPSF